MAARVLILVAVLATGSVAQLAFDDVAPANGTAVLSFGRGAAMVDLDGDGLLDIVAANGGQPDNFLRQKPDHTFEDASAAWGITPVSDESWGVVAADFDNDGDIDVFIPRGGFNASETNKLLRNDISTTGTLTDVSATAGDIDVQSKTFGGTALDYDLDGDLDIFISDTRDQGATGTCHLFRNDGGLVFTEVSQAAGVAIDGVYKHCSMGDIDNDGWPDVAVGEEYGDHRVFRNNQDGTFTDIAPSLGVTGIGDAFGLVPEDFDNDGWMDLWLPRWQLSDDGPTNLYMNNGDGTFTDVTSGTGFQWQTDMGHQSGDIDADGYPDVFIGTGAPSFASDDVLFLMTPNGTGGMVATNVSVSSGITASGPARSHGSPLGDPDGDGDIDMYVHTGGPSTWPDTDEISFFWRNTGNANGWVAVDLQGVISNRSAVGARSVAVTGTGREIHRHLTAGKGFANTDSPTQHFGLGAETDVDHIQVTWPSGIEQILLDPDPFERHAMIETGLRFEGPAVIGTVATIEMVGPPDAVAELLISGATTSIPLKKFGGILQVAEPWIGPIPWSLGPDGHFELLSPIPNDPLLIGATAYVQAWTHVPGTKENQALTNLLTITIE